MNATAGSQGMPLGAPGAGTRLDLGQVLKDGWVLFTRDWVALVVGSLLAGLIGTLTLGILAPVLTGGLYRMVVRRVREGRPAEIGDVFSCFDRFGPLFLFMVMMVAIFVGLMAVAALPLLAAAGFFAGDSEGLEAVGAGMIVLTIVLAVVAYVAILYLSIIWFYVFQLIVDRRTGLGRALRTSKSLVMGNSFWMHVAVILIVEVIASAVVGAVSSLTFGIGSILYVVVVPWVLTCSMSMYFQVAGERDLLPSATVGSPGSAYQGGGTPLRPGWGAPPPPAAGPGPEPPQPPTPPSPPTGA